MSKRVQVSLSKSEGKFIDDCCVWSRRSASGVIGSMVNDIEWALSQDKAGDLKSDAKAAEVLEVLLSKWRGVM